jgi:hypothetical protein
LDFEAAKLENCGKPGDRNDLKQLDLCMEFLFR